jgi:arginine utilization protein RocB
MILKENLYNLMKALIKVPGVSGTPSEVPVAGAIKDLVMEISYFKAHPENVKLVPVEKDHLGRSIVTAYMELAPESKETVILTGHYDVVDVEEYGSLKDYAFDLDEINARISELPMDDDSRKDLESGKWIFGRGTADMKFGHALCIELMRHFDEETKKAAEAGDKPPLNGNLLYVAVCGEETNSEGMLQAVSFLNDFEREKGVHYKAFLLTECFMSDDPSRDTDKYIHYGASGKVMPMFFFAGEACHGAEPFMGIDPDLMACEVYRRMHLNPEFCQTSMGEITPPPVCLSFRDMKPTYSVSTPLYTASYYNLVTVKLNPAEVMEKLLRIGREAFEASKDFVGAKAAEYKKATGADPVVYDAETCVVTFRELYEQACADFEGGKGALDGRIRELADGMIADGAEIQTVSVQIVKTVYEAVKAKKPAIVVAVIPPYYPDVYIPRDDKDAAELLAACGRIIDYAGAKYGETLKMKNYYMGISDMCYTGLAEGMNFDSLFKNLVGIGSIYQFPEDALRKFRVPGIVLGGYGKDFHKHTERLEKHYNFDVLPDLYDRLIRDLLK